MRTRNVLISLLMPGVLCVGPRPAHAWAPDGHIIVAHIAELRLTPEAQQRIDAMLNGDRKAGKPVRISDERFCNWADYVRKERSESAPWHFVDIPFQAEGYDPVRDCARHHGCVVEAVRDFSRLIGDPDVGQTERVEALKFLVHFVADLHQPLHCAERHGDKGGNLCVVTFPGIAKPQKLHVVWDVHLVQKNMHFHRMDALSFAELLNSRITKEQEAVWKQGTPADWAWESHVVAVTKTYATIPAGGGKILSRDYVETNQSVVDGQFKKAGIRLAELLNQAFR